ncbi:unnamed protein product [Enterobius vermicularis]|uniref:Thyroglobulin type-1 domain-containing protein n=1 Tax=Enterobius vermicularis TaxID=51028 RepID=A0A0N4UXK2_ENTVE|nr:unnamed protein product [Enterobius vermicularis]
MNLTTICGNNGRTYYAMCDIKRAICNGEPVKKLYDGPCSDAERCSLARAFWQDIAKKQGGDVFVPECNHTDGTYLSTQCFKKMGYCWCVDRYGRPIPGTSTKYSQPSCQHGSERISIKVGRRSHRVNGTEVEGITEITKGKGCTAVDRSSFNNKLYKMFEEEFDKTTVNSYERPNPLGVMKNKFEEFDLDKNSLLSKAEVKKMKKKLRQKMALPRPCLRRLFRNCDFNCNGTIEISEWIQCLGVNISSRF